MADAGMLADFGARTFRDAFGAQNDPHDMALFLRQTYGPEQQAAELRDPALHTLLAEEGGVLVGYAQLRAGPAPACVAGRQPMELQRIYVDGRWHGRGVAQRLMAGVLESGRERGADRIWLGVWEHNPRAQAFYRKLGFRDVGSQPFTLGTSRQTDRVMLLVLEE